MQIRCVTIVSMLLAAGCASAPHKTVIIPPRADVAYDTYHYAPAIRVGDTVIVSGILAGPGDDYDTRVRNMFKRLKATLEAAGASMDDVVEINTYHREPKDTAAFKEEFARFQVIHKEFFANGYPAWTAVGTTALLADGAPVEMRAVAVIGSGKGAVVQRAAQKPTKP